MPHTFCDEADEQCHLPGHMAPILLQHVRSMKLQYSSIRGCSAYLEYVHHFAVNDRGLTPSIHLIIHSMSEIVLRNVSPQNASELVALFGLVVLLLGYLVVTLVLFCPKKSHPPRYPQVHRPQTHAG